MNKLESSKKNLVVDRHSKIGAIAYITARGDGYAHLGGVVPSQIAIPFSNQPGYLDDLQESLSVSKQQQIVT